MWFPTVTCVFSESRARGTNIVRHTDKVGLQRQLTGDRPGSILVMWVVFLAISLVIGRPGDWSVSLWGREDWHAQDCLALHTVFIVV